MRASDPEAFGSAQLRSIPFTVKASRYEVNRAFIYHPQCSFVVAITGLRTYPTCSLLMWSSNSGPLSSPHLVGSMEKTVLKT